MNPTPMQLLEYPSGCPSCGHTYMTNEEVEEKFDYGTGSEKLAVSARVPVLTCANCGLSFTDEVGEERRHEAICGALRLLTPREVRGLRERIGLSQAELAALSGIGKASLGRWERGALIQNESNDKLLRLLSFPDNVERLKNLRRAPISSNVIPFKAKFRSISDDEAAALRPSAVAFRLYG